MCATPILVAGVGGNHECQEESCASATEAVNTRAASLGDLPPTQETTRTRPGCERDALRESDGTLGSGLAEVQPT
jgi:hypothetical protein